MPIVLGANVVNLITQDKQNVMGVCCCMEAPHVLRRTTACLLPVCRLARRGTGLGMAGFQFSPQENERERPPRALGCLPSTPAPRAPMGGVVVDAALSACRGLLVVPPGG